MNAQLLKSLKGRKHLGGEWYDLGGETDLRIGVSDSGHVDLRSMSTNPSVDCYEECRLFTMVATAIVVARRLDPNNCGRTLPQWIRAIVSGFDIENPQIRESRVIRQLFPIIEEILALTKSVPLCATK